MAQVQADRLREIEAVRPFIPVRLPTQAESRVLELVALGLSSREIADRLWISRQGVTYHIGNLFTKLRASSRAGLVSRAYAAGLLDPRLWPPQVQFDAYAPIPVRWHEHQPGGTSGE
jgi:DNA-binding CsgD family transcriptional regulator